VSEYPEVDGELSLKCYFKALEECYNLLKKKTKNEKLGIND
jgi:3-hydroxy-3-methylglutaryl CoA synthase